MPSRYRSVSAFFVAALLALGCAKPPPPKPPEPPSEPEPTVEVKPPPPPKCEALEEKCAAKEKTRAKIGQSDLAFSPVPGWVYAQGDSNASAQESDAGPCLAFMSYDSDPKDGKKDAAARETAFTALVQQLALDFGKKKVPWKKPLETKPIGDLKVGFWQFDGGARASKKGTVLVVHTNIGEGKDMVGVGFAPDDDQTGADQAIMKSIESIGPKGRKSK